MTIKQKKEMIPKIRKHIEELKKDMEKVSSPIAKIAIMSEIEKRVETIVEYQRHIDGLINGRTDYYK